MEYSGTTRVLIAVMTYPHPSKGYQELVCTAGITEDGDWIRLYPVDYRYRPNHQRYRKYQWIDVDIEKSPANNDRRKESYRPDLESIKVIGEPLPTANNWRERREIIDQMPHHTLNELKALHDADKTSLGIVRPKRVIDLIIEPATEEWKPEWQALFAQMRLFGPEQKPLQKLPFTFHYIFECEDSDKPHRAMCEDWEIGMLYINEFARLGNEQAAAESVRRKFLEDLCGPSKDTRFFMGTRYPYNVWLVLGVFWPPVEKQQSLF